MIWRAAIPLAFAPFLLGIQADAPRGATEPDRWDRRPGLWRTTAISEMVSGDAEARRAFQGLPSAGEPSVDESCVTAEAATVHVAGMWRDDQRDQCTPGTVTRRGDRLSGETRCTRTGRTERLRIGATILPERGDFEMTVETRARTAPDTPIVTKTRIAARRLGDCPAASRK